MININLLPEHLRKKEVKKLELPEIAFLPTVTAVVVVLIAIHSFLGILLFYKRSAAATLDKRLAELAPQKKECDGLRAAIDDANLKQAAIDKLLVKRLIWAKKLNELSDSMIPGIWLTKMYIEKESGKKDSKGKAAKTPPQDIFENAPKKAVKGKVKKAAVAQEKVEPPSLFVLEGCASSLFGEETANIGKFIKNLKSNAGFFEDFTEAKLDSIQRKKFKDTEVMAFKIYCYFKQ